MENVIVNVMRQFNAALSNPTRGACITRRIIAALAGEKTQQELNKHIHPAYSFIALLS
jgi:hypothetical protein